MNMKLARVSLGASTMFLILSALLILEVAVPSFITILADFLMIPFYLVVAVSFVYSLLVWIKDKNRFNLRYAIYSIISVLITSGVLFYILWQFATAMSNFD